MYCHSGGNKKWHYTYTKLGTQNGTYGETQAGAYGGTQTGRKEEHKLVLRRKYSQREGPRGDDKKEDMLRHYLKGWFTNYTMHL